MKIFIILCLIAVQSTALGQKITFNTIAFVSGETELDPKKEGLKKEVADFWKSYLVKYKDSLNKIALKDSWNRVELEQGFTDIVKSAQFFNAEPWSEFTIIDIKDIDNDYFKIKTMFSAGEDDLKMIYSVFNVYVKKEQTGYKLYNNLFFSKSSFKFYKLRDVDFYYPENYLFNDQKAKTMEEAYENIAALYKIKKNRLTYIIGNKLDEAYSLIGFDYMPISPSSLNSGRFIKDQNIIIACREDHLHEMIHAIFMPLYSKGGSLFHEGIATYYGGSGGRSYSDLVNDIKKDIVSHPEIDLSNLENLDKALNNGRVNNYYTVGTIN